MSSKHNFMSRNRNHWRDPSRERILREALKQAVDCAEKEEVPPAEIVEVWKLLTK